MDDLTIEELKLRADISHSLDVYIPNEMDTEEEIKEGLCVLTDLGQKFRHIHVELKNKLGDEHKEHYPEYEKMIEFVINFTKTARKELKVLKQNEEKVKGEKEKTAVKDEQKEVLKVEEELLNLKIKQLQSVVDVQSIGNNIQDIENYISKMEGFIDDYFALSGKLKFLFGNEYENLYGSKLVDRTNEMHQDVKMAKLLRREILEVFEKNKISEAEEIERSNHILNSENLSSEIHLRCESLQNKYDKDFKNMSDYQILEVSQNKTLDTEFNGILEKITTLGTLASMGGEKVQTMLKCAVKQRDLVVTKMKKFQENLQLAVTERDITPDKLKNASVLKIELPKFSGYNSKIDFFTFKSEFQKLVEPIVQKKYWSDYLKRNYLSGSALTLVEKETDYTKIWDRLLESYGNPRLLLQNKLCDLDKIGGLWKIKGDEKIAHAIAGLLNSMKDLSFLATEHNIEGQLYEGGGLEKVMNLIGDYRHRKFRSKNLDSSPSKKDEWGKLMEFLKHELLLRERLSLDSKTAQLMGISTRNEKRDGNVKVERPETHGSTNHVAVNNGLKCHFCDKDGHTVVTTSKGNKIIPYYVCEIFVKLSPEERLSKLKSKNLCTGCLFPGAVKGPKHRCFFTNYCCPHPSHERNEKLHILLCDIHKRENANLELLEKFKDKFIKNCKVTLPQHSKHLSCFSEMVGVTETMRKILNESDISENAIFQLQTTEVQGIRLNLFFDSGCGDMLIKKSAVDKLAGIGRAKQVISGPLVITGVGDQKSVSDDGVYSVSLPLYNGTDAVLSGLCMPKITAEFPIYNLSVVEKDIHDKCKKVGGHELVSRLPKLPSNVGGETDILIGIKYAKYFPKNIFEFETGLGIYESAFKSPCGARGVVAGPHKEFSKIEKNFKGLYTNEAFYFEGSVNNYRASWKLENEIPLLGIKMNLKMPDIDVPICCSKFMNEIEFEHDLCISDVSDINDMDIREISNNDAQVCIAKKTPKCVKQFDEIEKAGTEVTYRCVDCRSCLKCKNGMRFDAVSIQEEIEQGMIERSVDVDVNRGITTAKLPFVVEPDSRLVPNEHEALKVYRGQIRKLNAKPDDKAAVIEFEKKLHDLGFVDYVSNLDDSDKMLILSNLIRYFIPWRAVWNAKSLSTPCRMVFDASQSTKGGCSLNSLLAKGANCMNKLIEILIRWVMYKHAFHTDVTKMYNAVRLDKMFWRYQLYLWDDNLAENVTPRWKVIKTLIYGVRSSGNLAEYGLRRTAEICKNEFPRAHNVIMYDTYMDDCVSGTESSEMTRQVTDELQVTLRKGGFNLKGFTISGQSPSENLSSDQESVLVAGLKWFPKGDFIKLNINELNFNKKARGRKSECNVGIIPENLTKRDCVSKVSEVFDPLGKVAPLLGGMKMDISVLHQSRLDWDDPIPNELKNIWAANFDLIKEIGNIQFHRAIVPNNAASLHIDTIDVADASENLVCAAIYARFKLRDGKNSCQLIFARTKIIHDLSMPRAELVAALLNASTGHIVRSSLKHLCKRSWKLTDSQVVLHWINSIKSALKMWVRNRVVEIKRLSESATWWYVNSENMIADLGTRKGVNISQVGPKSAWIQGYPWMSDEEANFPIKTANEIVLSNTEKGDLNKERVIDEPFEDVKCLTSKYVPIELGERYKFSKYLIDPNKFRFRTVIRVLALVFFFLQKVARKLNRSFEFLKKRDFCRELNPQSAYVVSRIDTSAFTTKNPNVVVVHLSEDLLNDAKGYFFQKAALEVRQFVDPRKYANNSVWRDGILYYTGRILSTQQINSHLNLGDVCLDLSASTFIVPITDALSPIAYAIVSETHWYHPDVSHGGVESVLRHSQSTAYIIGGRDLVKGIKKGCVKCRILHKKNVRIAMGPVGENNLQIAPPFYICQVDICGPFNAYSPVNKRATLKVWYVVFCCTTTGAVDCRIMESYTADAFILAFIRFACRFGYPQMMLPDEGSQLVKGCEDVIISFSDVKHKLSVEYGVEFKVCPVGSHYVHGKVERKIQDIKRGLKKCVHKNRLSVLQWETLGQQIANSINNVPIGLGNKSEMLENLDILTPNRLILGRNNNRNPTAPLEIKNDVRKIVESNNTIFQIWFKEWLTSYVPTLIDRPKWFVTERSICVGDIVLFLKSDREFDLQYQYGIVTTTIESRDGIIRVVEVQYQNHTENTKRFTKRGVRELVVIHPIDEIGISKELQQFANGI